MAHQNTISDIEAEQRHALLHPENHHSRGNMSNFPNYAAQLLQTPVSENVDPYHFHGYYVMGTSVENPGNYVWTCCPLFSCESAPMMPFNNRSLEIPASSSSRSVSVSHGLSMHNTLPFLVNHHAAESSTSASERNDHFVDNNTSLSKQKSVEVAEGNSALVNISSSSSAVSYISQISGQHQWDASFQHVAFPNAPAYNSWLPIERSPRNAIVNSSAFCPEFPLPNTYPWPGYIGQCFQTPSNMWSASAQNPISCEPFQWSFVNSMSSAQGILPISTTVGNTGGGPQEYPNSLNWGLVPYMHQHPIHMLRVPGLMDHSQPHMPYLQSTGANSSTSSMCPRPRFVPFIPNSEPAFGLSRGPMQVSLGIGHGIGRSLAPEHAALMDISRLYEISSVNDEHRDLRLDIDDMTYEELLMLEEQIGDVSTGLSEEFILDNLKMSLYQRGLSTRSNNSAESAVEDEACMICQVEYNAGEHIGTLDCGHRYHMDCIKQWLVLKNVCPVCKKSGLLPKSKNG